MQTQTVKIAEIRGWEHNPRTMQPRNEDADKQLADSIRAVGILQPPTLRKNGKGYLVEFGHRRVRCAKLAGETEIEAFISERSEADGAMAALHENTEREDMDQMDEYVAFANLVKLGKSEHDIALAFGIDPKTVEKRLALGRLDERVINAYRKGRVDIEACVALTMVPKAEQVRILKSFGKDRRVLGWRVKEIVKADKIDMARAIFDPALYDGKTQTDLFSETVYAVDAARFIELQNEAIMKAGEAFEKAGASFVSVMNGYFCSTGSVRRCYEHEPDMQKPGKPPKALREQAWGVAIEFDARSGRVNASYAVRNERMKTETADKADTPSDDPTRLTSGQSLIMGEAGRKVFVDNAGLEEALWFQAIDAGQRTAKAGMPDLKDLIVSLIEHATWDISRADFDRRVAAIAKKRKWNIRDSWTPDEAFLAGYKIAVLDRIAGEVIPGDRGYAALKKKTDKVAYLAKAFADGSTAKLKSWLPF